MSSQSNPLHLPESVDIVLSGVANDMQISPEELIALALNCYIKTYQAIEPERIAHLKKGKQPMHDNAWDIAWFAFQSEVEEAEIHQRLAVPHKTRTLLVPKPKTPDPALLSELEQAPQDE